LAKAGRTTLEPEREAWVDGRRDLFPPQVRLVLRFALHTIIGVALFLLIGGAAVFLNYCTIWIEGTGISPYVMYGVHGIEFLLFAIDVICFLVFVFKETWIFVRDIIRL
jgi:TRAP-type C4-dicarboxylate transport system permease small subunit